MPQPQLGGDQSRNAPASGKPLGHTETQRAVTTPAKARAVSTPKLGSVKLAMPGITALPPPSSLGAMLGLLFGQMLGGQTGPARDAAIGAAAYTTASHELEQRLEAIRSPGIMPTVLGEMPVAPAPISRDRGLTL